MVFADPVLPQVQRASLRALAVLCLVALAGCHGKAKDAPAAAPPAPVEVQPAARGEMLAVYSGTAPIEADGEAVVVAKVGGELRQLLVEEGAHVRKGQVLARLDGERLRLEAAQSKAQLSKLERDYKRNVELQQRGLVAVSAFENLRYEVDAARAAYDLTALQLSYTDIRAPIDGVVAERFVKAGNTLNPNDKLFRVADLSPLVAHVHVPESELRKLRTGQVASAQVDAAGGAFQSFIQRISPVVDSNTGTFKVTLELRDPSNKLKPGMFARIDIVHERRTDVVADLGGARALDAGHRRHDAEHGSDDAEAREGVGDLLHGMGRLGGFVVVCFQFVFEQALEFMGIEVATRNQTQAVRDELHHVMVGQHERVFLEDVALVGVLDVLLDGQDTIFTGHHENVVNELEQLDVFLAPVARTLHESQGSGERALHDLDRVADEEGAKRRATDDHDFERVPEQQETAATGHEPTQHAAEDNQGTDDREHEFLRDKTTPGTNPQRERGQGEMLREPHELRSRSTLCLCASGELRSGSRTSA